MVLEIQKKKIIFTKKQIWFTSNSYDIAGVDRVIFRDCKGAGDPDRFDCKELTTLIIDLTNGLDLIWKNMNKSSCRYAIGRAERDAIVIKINKTKKYGQNTYKRFAFI